MKEFRKELEELINSNSVENASNTPDFILAEYLTDCLISFGKATNARDKHYNITHEVDTELDDNK